MKTKSKKLVKTTKTLKEYYSFKNYSPNKIQRVGKDPLLKTELLL